MHKLAQAADALIALCESDEFKEDYAHQNLFVTKADLIAIAELLRDQWEENQ